MLLSEMFGVERDTEFGVEGYSVTFKIATFLEKYEYLMYRWSAKLDWREAEGTMLCNVIAGSPDNIVRLPPPLTDEQREQLKAIWTLGGRWLAKDMPGDTFAFGYKPVKDMEWVSWIMSNDDKDENLFSVYRDLDVCSLVSWSDAKPYDISKVLGIKN